ncbi:MAG TPA: glycosyltransferase [Candidatus Baltobacteraceae bacterium]|jgi:glycosyltransferase involved in cell wall biosynthesis|nr:glycosyltransferase [Candidatus Baltobacteraceae bacterium]
MNRQGVAVVMSTFNEERDVDRSIEAILNQTVSPDVIVVDGGSSDKTVERLQQWADRDPRVRVIADGVRRSLPDALNVAIALTDQPFVAKVDARTFIAPDFLERALDVFAAEGAMVACVGGRPEQYGETQFGQGVAFARMSPFGVGGSGYADVRDYADVDTVQCGIYRREAVIAAGGFDPELQFGEDEELNWRLRRAGYRIVRDTRVRFRYSTRPTWRAAFRQYRNYGQARVRVWEKHPDFLRPHHLVPSIAVASGALLCVMAASWAPARGLLTAAVALYGGAALAAAAAVCRADTSSIPYTAAAFSSLHLGYGVGLLEGLARLHRGSPGKTLHTSSR